MYKLYNVKRWGSMGPHFVLEELGVPYQNVWLTPEQVRGPEYQRINPLNLIPTLGLTDGRVVTESMAIVTFLTDAHADKGLAPKPGTADHAVYLSALAYLASNLYPMINIATDSGAFTNLGADATEALKQRAVEHCDRLFDIVEAKLKSEGPFLLGEKFSAADLYLFMLAVWALPSEQVLHARCPAIARVIAHVRARPKLKAALETHGVLDIAAAAA
jgi:glutathione S-transferase